MAYQFNTASSVSAALAQKAQEEADKRKKAAEEARIRDLNQQKIESQRSALQAQNDRVRAQMQYAAAESARQDQERSFTLAKTVQAVVVVGALNATVRKDLLDKLDETHKVETPFVNHLRSQVTHQFANSPIADQLRIQLEYDGTTPQEAEELMRPNPMIQAQLDSQKQTQRLEFLYATHDIDFQTKKATENHLQTAREIYANLFGKDPSGKEHTIDEQINQAIEAKLELARHVEQEALRAGQTQEEAREYAQEIAATFVLEQTELRDATEQQRQVAAFLKNEHQLAQEEIKGIASKEQLAHIRIATTGTDALHQPGATNLDEEALAKIDEQRKARELNGLNPQTQAGYDALGNPIGEATKFEPKEPEIIEETPEQEPINTAYATAKVETNNQYSDGTPNPNHIPNDLLAAQAAENAEISGGSIAVNQNNAGIQAYTGSPVHGTSPSRETGPYRELGPRTINPYPHAQN